MNTKSELADAQYFQSMCLEYEADDMYLLCLANELFARYLEIVDGEETDEEASQTRCMNEGFYFDMQDAMDFAESCDCNPDLMLGYMMRLYC